MAAAGADLVVARCKTSAEVIDYVQNTPGAVGYIDAADLKPGLKVVLRP